MIVFTRAKTESSCAAALVAVMVGLVGACASGDDATLLTPGWGTNPPWFGYGVEPTEANTPIVLVSELRVCLDRPGEVEIVDIAFQETFGELQIDAFSVQDISTNPELGTLAGDRPLADHGYLPGYGIVNVACPPDEYGLFDEHIPNAALGIQFSKLNDDAAGGRNLVVTYEMESGRRDELVHPVDFTICAADATDDDCSEFEYPEG